LVVYDLTERKSYRAVLQRAKPGAPVLVQRLDRRDTYYYVVPVREKAATTPLAICVDARTGEYRESAVRPKANVFTTTDPRKVGKDLVGRRLDLPDRLGRIVVRPDALCQYPLLVWKPCRESLSPYFPFHLFTVGDQHIYVRTDGAVFTRLHDTDRGI
jgi:hypothetical protein